MSPSLPRMAATWCAVALAVALVGLPDSKALERAVSKIFVAHVVPPDQPEDAHISIFDSPSLLDVPLDRPLADAALESARQAPLLHVEQPEAGGSHVRALAPLYASFLALQALDVHSTLRALNRGARESNPIMAPFTERPAAFVAMKAATAAGVLYMTERVRRRSPWSAILMMAAFNSVYGTVVANNYRLGNQLGP